MKGAYLLFIIIVMLCLFLVDYRYKLVYFSQKKQAVRSVFVAVCLFIVWDLLGIILRIFYIGSSNHLLGLRIGQFPLEELFFLTLLCYQSLLVFRYLQTRGKKQK